MNAEGRILWISPFESIQHSAFSISSMNLQSAISLLHYPAAALNHELSKADCRRMIHCRKDERRRPNTFDFTIQQYSTLGIQHFINESAIRNQPSALPRSSRESKNVEG